MVSSAPLARVLLLAAACAAASGSGSAEQQLPAAAAGPPGSDPTGQTDSSAALNAAIRTLCEATADGPAPRDAVLDLAGGIYRMDAPLAVNSSLRCSGMLRIKSGTLLASAALAQLGNHSFLVTVLDYWGGLGVSLEQLIFASDSHGGGLRVDAAHHVHVSDSNFLNFATVGIWVSLKAAFALERLDQRYCKFPHRLPLSAIVFY